MKVSTDIGIIWCFIAHVVCPPPGATDSSQILSTSPLMINNCICQTYWLAYPDDHCQPLPPPPLAHCQPLLSVSPLSTLTFLSVVCSILLNKVSFFRDCIEDLSISTWVNSLELNLASIVSLHPNYPSSSPSLHVEHSGASRSRCWQIPQSSHPHPSSYSSSIFVIFYSFIIALVVDRLPPLRQPVVFVVVSIRWPCSHSTLVPRHTTS